MKIVVLDGYAANPGDLSWEGLKTLANARFTTALLPKKYWNVLPVQKRSLQTK